MTDRKRLSNFGRLDPMPAADQLAEAQLQLELNQRYLEGATWAVHPRDLEKLRTVIGDAT